MGVSNRFQTVQEDVHAYCREVGRDPRSVRIVAVSKTVDVATVGEAISAGVCDFGENRPDSLTEKHAAYNRVTWHFIGNIQSRKLSSIVGAADLIHSVYQRHHLPIIDAAAEKAAKVQDILLEVNVSGEESKGGLRVDEVESFIEECNRYDHIRLKGLMTMAPQGDLAQARECFDSLASLREAMIERFTDSDFGQDFSELSMGMSEDWREAIAAGATMVRIGRAIFDEAFESADN